MDVPWPSKSDDLRTIPINYLLAPAGDIFFESDAPPSCLHINRLLVKLRSLSTRLILEFSPTSPASSHYQEMDAARFSLKAAKALVPRCTS